MKEITKCIKIFLKKLSVLPKNNISQIYYKKIKVILKKPGKLLENLEYKLQQLSQEDDCR